MNNSSQKDIENKILKLKKDRNAIILAHNYVLGEIQDIADFCGDSLELSRKAAGIPEETIVFAGVKFMAETAKILCPEKTVLHPVAGAGCPMADMATVEDVRNIKEKYPSAVTVCYVNSNADVKTEADICCTSGNAEKLVASIPEDKDIIFLPDQNLGANIARKLNRKIILWEGYCPTHMRISPEMVKRKQDEFPESETIVHLECKPEVVAIADAALSTAGMLKYAKNSTAKKLIVGTEIGMIHRLQKENPGKIFIPLSEQAVCMDMKMPELKDILNSLEKMETQIILDKETIRKAHLPIKKMLDSKF
ncbi:MAG: quinolinate synthase NadA [Victivallales bacterium]|nr:quinolinate synthase NadA [Victivallales bacterium]